MPHLYMKYLKIYMRKQYLYIKYIKLDIPIYETYKIHMYTYIHIHKLQTVIFSKIHQNR